MFDDDPGSRATRTNRRPGAAPVPRQSAPVVPARRRLLEAMAALGLGAPAALARAHCPPIEFTRPPEGTSLRGPAALVVTHATSMYDARLATKRGLDALVGHARLARLPVIYLADDSPPATYFADDCRPTAWWFSEGGELAAGIDTDTVLLAGGHLEICLRRTVFALLDQWSILPPRDRTIRLVADAVYSNGRDVPAQAPYAAEVSRFLDVVAAGRPGGEHWRKLTLLETLSLIRAPDAGLAWLAETLPAGSRVLPPGWRIRLVLDGTHRAVLREPRGRATATLTYDVVPSMIED